MRPHSTRIIPPKEIYTCLVISHNVYNQSLMNHFRNNVHNLQIALSDLCSFFPFFCIHIKRIVLYDTFHIRIVHISVCWRENKFENLSVNVEHSNEWNEIKMTSCRNFFFFIHLFDFEQSIYEFLLCIRQTKIILWKSIWKFCSGKKNNSNG